MICSIDKLRIVAFAAKKNSKEISSTNDEGEIETIKVLYGTDALVGEIFNRLGFNDDAKTNSYVRSKYSLKHGFSAFEKRNGLLLFECGGTFFLEPNPLPNTAMIFSLCKELSGFNAGVSEAHLAITGNFTKDFHAFATRLKRDWDVGKCLVRTFEENKKISTLMAGSSVSSLVVYNKSLELNKKVSRKSQESRANYIKNFENKYSSLEGQTRIEFRFRSSRLLTKFSDLLKQQKYQEAIEELLAQGLKRYKLPTPLVNKLKKSISKGI